MTDAPPIQASPSRPPRLVSLDVFRGATVAAMILVNNPGTWSHIYWPLDHAEWHGCTPTDLIMPFFLFIVGVSIVFAMDSRRHDTAQHRSLLWRAVRRTVTLFVLAWLLGLFPSSPASLDQLTHQPLAWLQERLGGLRIMGVLQRIGVVYLACVVLFLKSSPRVWVGVCAAILLGYWAALTLVPVPISGGAWQPANLQPATNLGAWVDRTILTQNHLYKHAAFDPEGPFSTISAISTGLIGVIVGYQLKRRPASVAGPLAVGVTITALGLLWSLVFLFNKQLWTSSYSLLSGGLATLFLAGAYWLMDLKGFRRFTAPFVAFGVNAITAFWASGLMVRAMGLWPLSWGGKSYGLKDYLYQRFVSPQFSSPELASLVGACLFVVFWWAIMAAMYRMKWIIKV